MVESVNVKVSEELNQTEIVLKFEIEIEVILVVAKEATLKEKYKISAKEKETEQTLKTPTKYVKKNH